MTVPCDGGIINIRVGAIILQDGKFLMVGNERSDYFYSVGGCIRFGETADEAVIRAVLKGGQRPPFGSYIFNSGEQHLCWHGVYGEQRRSRLPTRSELLSL